MEEKVEQLTEREKRFLGRIAGKYAREGASRQALIRSMVIFAVILTVFHFVEYLLPWKWLAYLIVMAVGLTLFYQYRRFSVFTSRIMGKMYRILESQEGGGEGQQSESGTTDEHK